MENLVTRLLTNGVPKSVVARSLDLDPDLVGAKLKEVRVNRYGTDDMTEYMEQLQWDAVDDARQIIANGSAAEKTRVLGMVLGKQVLLEREADTRSRAELPGLGDRDVQGDARGQGEKDPQAVALHRQVGERGSVMGFRSMLISESTSLTATPEFIEKWGTRGYWVNELPHCFTIASMQERKFYGPRHELFDDIQRLLNDPEANEWRTKEVELILFHECGGVDKVTIFKDLIQYTRPEYQAEWIDVEEPSHFYDYGCSDSEIVAKNKDLASAKP